MEKSTIAFIYDLPYGDTVWGKFYQSYKELSHIELRKVLKSESAKMNATRVMISNNPYAVLKVCKSLFYKTDDGKTPTILLQDTSNYKREKNFGKKLQIAKEVFAAYKDRRRLEFDEVISYYRELRAKSQTDNRTHRRTHAAEQIECPTCKQMITRTNKSRHFKTHLRDEPNTV